MNRRLPRIGDLYTMSTEPMVWRSADTTDDEYIYESAPDDTSIVVVLSEVGPTGFVAVLVAGVVGYVADEWFRPAAGAMSLIEV